MREIGSRNGNCATPKREGEQITIEAQGDFKKYQRLRDLINKTNKADPKPEHLKELRQLLDETPELWRAAGSLAQRALNHICRTYFEQSGYVLECAKREMEELRESLGYETSPPLERFLIEQILVCRLNLYVLEINTATKLCESHNTETGLYWDRRLTSAQRRFARACESLARIRKLTAQTRAAGVGIPPMSAAPLRAVSKTGA